MNKAEIATYFDDMAPGWDAHMVIDDEKIDAVMDAADVKAGATVLDVACGTGVLFPYYLARKVSHVIGVDLSPQMAKIAASKFHDPRIEVLCADAEKLEPFRLCDCCIVYNAFPHFQDPKLLLRGLSKWLKPQGRLVVAHGMSLEALKRHHAGTASQVSREMLSTDELSCYMKGEYEVFLRISDDQKYIVAGKKKS